MERHVCQFQTVSTEGFTPTNCAQFCAHPVQNLPAERVHGLAFRFHADVRIAFHHGAGDVSRERHHSGIGRLRLRNPRNECMAQIVEPARHVCFLARALPGNLPSMHWLGRDNLVGALLPFVSGKAVLLTRKYMMLWLHFWEKAMPMR